MSWDDLKSIFRPETVHMGVMKVDPDLCTHCGQCLENCPLRAYEMDENEVPRLKADYACFSCFNCMVTCPVEAISIVDVYHVDEGFYATQPHKLPAKMPLAPKDAEGKPAQWTPVEKVVYERRSVRNFRDKSVPEPLIRRVLEAGRFAPSGGNCQPWQFIVITDKALIKEMDQAILSALSGVYGMYKNEEMVKGLAAAYEASPTPGTYDPRIILGGMGSLAKNKLPIFLDAPAAILVACDDRAIGGPQIAAGICGQNMNLVACSLGLGFCWVGFSQLVNRFPNLMEKLGLSGPWKIHTAAVLGYPRFKQEGVVPREFRPVTWFREGTSGPQIEE